MDADHLNDYSYLDQIRINEGSDKCRSAFGEISRKDVRRAGALLNDRRLMFPCLYILYEPILRQHIQKYLNTRNGTALQIIDRIKSAKADGIDYLSSKWDSVRPVLKWILKTGSAGEISEDDYEEILDVTVSALINIYKDADSVPPAVDLIFKRDRNGRYIHDLVWALFRLRDPEVLKLIARRLRSSDPKDAELAAELLNLDETDVPAAEVDGEGRYEGYLHWLEENQPYLYFTGESFQYSSRPVFCAVDLERKYLQKAASSHDRQAIAPLDDEESKSAAAFKQLSAQEQKVLSEYSQKICSKSVPAWKEWLHAPVGEQIKAAKAGLEGKA